MADDSSTPNVIGPQTLEEWRDQAIFQARLVAQLNRDCMRLQDALWATAEECSSGLADGCVSTNWQRVAERAAARAREALAKVVEEATDAR